MKHKSTRSKIEGFKKEFISFARKERAVMPPLPTGSVLDDIFWIT
nr:hypothetical protein [Erwinia tracheiphila]